MSNPSKEHWQGIKCIFHYMKGTLNHGLCINHLLKEAQVYMVIQMLIGEVACHQGSQRHDIYANYAVEFFPGKQRSNKLLLYHLLRQTMWLCVQLNTRLFGIGDC